MIIAAIVLRITRFGRYTYAIGSNAAAARRAGINVDRHLIKVYALSGLLAGAGGRVRPGPIRDRDTSTHSTDNLNAISAVVIGGTSLFGGMGSIIGTVIGAFIRPCCATAWSSAASIRSGSRSLVGAILIVAVYFDQRGEGRSECSVVAPPRNVATMPLRARGARPGRPAHQD